MAETLLFATTAAGLPTGRTLGALADGVTSSWHLVLQSTWPARPDPDLLIFVPLLVVVAAVLGAEVLLRVRAPLPALLPSLAVVVLSQVYAASAPGPAAVAALAYAAAAGMALAGRATLLRFAVCGGGGGGRGRADHGVRAPAGPARYSLQDGQAAALEQALPENPLNEIAFRLQHPDTEVFRVDGGAGWTAGRCVVLDGFDGVNWTATAGRTGGSAPSCGPGPP